MFYENERIVRKQMKIVNSRAYTIIQDLESKGLADGEIIACLGLLLKEDNSEFQVDVLDHALKTVNSRQERLNAKQVIDSSYCFNDGRIQRKSVASSEQYNKSSKRKA